MQGQLEVHWDTESLPNEPQGVVDHCETFEPSDDKNANHLFDILLAERGNYNIRLVRVERFASCGG